jgi:hypothetical protein
LLKLPLTSYSVSFAQIAAEETLNVFTTTVLQTSPEQLSQECGVDYSSTLVLLKQLQTYTMILLDSAQRSMELMSCRNIVPLYTSTIYDATCDYSITAATWIFASSFIISFFGMLMLMFRGAYYPIYYFEGKELEYGTSDDEAGLEEETSDDEDYIDESMVDTDVYDGDQLDRTLYEGGEDDEDGTDFPEGESIEQDESQYDGSQFSGSTK